MVMIKGNTLAIQLLVAIVSGLVIGTTSLFISNVILGGASIVAWISLMVFGLPGKEATNQRRYFFMICLVAPIVAWSMYVPLK